MIAARISLAAAALFAGITTAAAMDTAPNDVMVVDGVVAKSLTGAPGDVAEGRKAFANRKLGNCLACHANSDMSEQLFHGEVGPSLDGVASRWSEEELRAIVVNSKAVFGEQTVMPGFYSLEVGQNVREDLVGKTILTAEQVESIVAYLGTLK
ncbi:sulfur oxidation c-type cytochrome SoxX [Pelagibius marinus]|uniref:sulfur oxidation c-type cytochrome SoxX n=1 Tax=Pelagibius marinus TaxID=2762760 RepID=UPI001872F73A|nr:sulfur oxidation c-type cytochrome SoxX [Pelagibius marinus]